MLSYSSLADWYETTFALIQHHKYSLSDVEGMIPFERTLYLDMLQEYLRKQQEENK